jgi:hypothetical protein
VPVFTIRWLPLIRAVFRPLADKPRTAQTGPWLKATISPSERELAPASNPGAIRVRSGWESQGLKDNGPLAEMRVTDERGWALFFSSHVPFAFRGRTKVSRPLNVPEPVIPW